MKNIKWIIIFFLLCAVCLAVWLGRGGRSAFGVFAEIRLENELIKTVDLSCVSEPYEFDIETEDGGYNRVRVEQGRIAVIEADCPNNDCVRQGYINNDAVPIVCLPHRLSITIVSSEDNDVDAIAGGY